MNDQRNPSVGGNRTHRATDNGTNTPPRVHRSQQRLALFALNPERLTVLSNVYDGIAEAGEHERTHEEPGTPDGYPGSSDHQGERHPAGAQGRRARTPQATDKHSWNVKRACSTQSESRRDEPERCCANAQRVKSLGISREEAGRKRTIGSERCRGSDPRCALMMMLHPPNSARLIEHMQRSLRWKTIIHAVRTPGGVRVSELVEATGASHMTIRRDLAELEQRGMLRRTHGGAVSLPARGTHLPFAVRADSQAEQKRAVAAAAAALIPNGSSVFIDAGTTCTAVAHALSGRDITVMALSVHAASALGERPGARILTPGGLLDIQELTWTGYSAVLAVQDFRADAAVLGVCAWDETGMSATSKQDADTKRALMQASTTVIAVTTADKFNTSATFAVSPSSHVHTVVTNRAAHVAPAWLAAAGVDVLVADLQTPPMRLSTELHREPGRPRRT